MFMETWLGGGLGRAQGGYDEMMFRAMVRDGAPFYDPLALVSTGTEVDFQVGANAYLYGEDPGMMAHVHASLACWFLGDDAAALAHKEAALRLGEMVDHPNSLAMALFAGTSPMLAEWMMNRMQWDLGPALYSVVWVAIALVAVYRSKETYRESL